MIYQVDRIVQDVRVALDENSVDNALITDGDEDTLMLDEIIRSKIVEGVEVVHRAAPYRFLEQGHNFPDRTDAVYWGDQASGWVLLPLDYMRLVVFEMSDWERPVYSAITPNDPQYKLQRSRVKALRGTCQRPVCAEVVRPAGRALEFYSCKDETAVVTKGVYIPYPEIDELGGIDISERCYEAVVYEVAGLTYLTRGEKEAAALMFNQVKTLLEG